jgi:S-adenosyl-L-methionine hydrolase (adenosine-forming)
MPSPTALPPILALYSDFDDDAFVAMLKGKLLRYIPQARLVDVSHRLPRFDIVQAALLLRRVYSHYPAGTIHLIGIDSGIGQRRVLATRIGGQIFLAPDNGVLGLILEREPAAVHAIPAADGMSFLARDLLAPLAARLAEREALISLGPEVTDWRRVALPQPQALSDGWQGEVLFVDSFGNLVTNFTRAQCAAAPATPPAISLGPTMIAGWYSDYSQAPPSELFLLWGAEGWLEISLPRASAAQRLDAHAGTTLILR